MLEKAVFKTSNIDLVISEEIRYDLSITILPV